MHVVTIGHQAGRKIDFICERNGEKLYIQVAYLIPDEKVTEREFGNILKIKDNFPKVVVSMDEVIGKSYRGILHYHVINFLQALVSNEKGFSPGFKHPAGSEIINK
ncbi:MAG: hypothetical protein KJ607_09215 [Bacteroidetes bacterium]|nr:hypothetical protein [Bacteroidota bacterium]